MDRLQLGNALWDRVLRPGLFLLDAEDAHRQTIGMLKVLQAMPGGLALLRTLYQSPHADSMQTMVGGVPWRNPVGLAAGFDKHAEVVPALDAIGFGAIEIGTVLPRPQAGNPKPRVFRYPKYGAVVNRYGFNSIGAEGVADNLRRCHRRHEIRAAIGFSISKNKRTANENAVDDYIDAFRALLPVMRPGRDYVAFNVSSPNTPGLRDLFRQLPQLLAAFMQEATVIARARHRDMPPVYLKVAPDGLTADDFPFIIKACRRNGIVAIIATNTTVDTTLKDRVGTDEEGGLSGKPLATKAMGCVAQLSDARGETTPTPDIIGVGGIDSARASWDMCLVGAKVVQLYTGLVFEGPGLPAHILGERGNPRKET